MNQPDMNLPLSVECYFKIGHRRYQWRVRARCAWDANIIRCSVGHIVQTDGNRPTLSGYEDRDTQKRFCEELDRVDCEAWRALHGPVGRDPEHGDLFDWALTL